MPDRRFRRFLSQEEEVEWLTAYREQLLREAAEVEKQIATLSKEQDAGSGSQPVGED
jgi:exonuclease I